MKDSHHGVETKEKESSNMREESSWISSGWSAVVVAVCAVVTVLNTYQFYQVDRSVVDSHHILSNSGVSCNVTKKRTYVVYDRRSDTSHLKHVFAVLNRLGYERSDDMNSEWDLMWAHDYPFTSQTPADLKHLHHHQKVNHFPGSGYITNKVDLATSGLPYIPPAFRVPEENDKLLEYIKTHPNVKYVQKDNNHRGIQLRTSHQLNLNSTGTFVQVYIDNPLLVDGYKFDIGIYTILTSIDPLRLYVYNGDVLFRFCPQKYHPFDPDDEDKYVIGDDYLPIWEVPSLQKYYVDLGFSMRDSFNAHMVELGHNPNKIWNQVDDAIQKLYLKREELLIRSTSYYKSKINFFELVRIDFVVDENFDVHMMEANMSPNLSSAHFPPNILLYEQVLFNLMSLVGIARHSHIENEKYRNREEASMKVADKNIMVYPEICGKPECSSCLPLECQICKMCMTPETASMLKTAYLEHTNRQNCKRIFPPPTNVNARIDLEEYTPENRLIVQWFQGKCKTYPTWCN